MQLGIALVGSRQQDFPHRFNMAIRRKLDPVFVAFGARRQDLDDEERVLDHLPSRLDRSARRRDVGHKIKYLPGSAE
jgi:hypothetical protein